MSGSVRAPLVAVVLVATSLAGACNGATGVVTNGSVSACYRAIPIGREAVHDPRAHLIGVHRVDADRVGHSLPEAARSQLAAEPDTSVCVMAFKGSFTAGQVSMAPSGQQGPYALVLVSAVHLQLLASVVLGHLPRAFGGRTV